MKFENFTDYLNDSLLEDEINEDTGQIATDLLTFVGCAAGAVIGTKLALKACNVGADKLYKYIKSAGGKGNEDKFKKLYDKFSNGQETAYDFIGALNKDKILVDMIKKLNVAYTTNDNPKAKLEEIKKYISTNMNTKDLVNIVKYMRKIN
jgi:hypothetical protein